MVGGFFAGLLLVVAAGVAAAAEEAPAPRETFVVRPFANARGVKALGHLEAGLPALIAERLALQRPLRFVGGPALLPRGTAAPAAKWVVEGTFERQADWTVQVQVTVKGSAPDGPSAQAVRTGAKEVVARLALDAALEAFAGLPGVKLAPASAAVLAPFSRDPYAFVLYGRGVATYLGQPRGADRAAEVLKRSLVIDPRVPETRRFLGMVHLEAQRPGHARAMFASALDLRPGYPAALSALAALDRSAALPSARERYETLVQLDPEDSEARRNYGELLSEAGQLVEAQGELEKVVATTPTDLRARRALALVLAARRAGPELVADLEEIMRLDPEDVDARMDLAAAYTSVARAVDAEAVYDEVLRRKPRHSAALKLAGDLARARGDVKKAAALYGRLRGVAPQDPRPLFLLGTAQYEAGNLDAAERMFSEGARFPGMLGEAYSNLGAIALRRGQAKEALWLLSRATKHRPGKANVRYNYAMALYSANRHADALNELRTAAVLDPADAGVQFFAGVVALRLGLLHDAEEAFREALRLDPRHQDARHNLALLEPLINPRREGSLSFSDGPIPLQLPTARAPDEPRTDENPKSDRPPSDDDETP
jgi:Flp pilus assembly protein TadD